MYEFCLITVGTVNIHCIYKILQMVLGNKYNVPTLYICCRYIENRQKYISAEYFLIACS